jgi:signal transduction histidine kinase
LVTLAAAAPVDVQVTGAVGRYPTEIEAAAYFCISEAITNAVKHAEPPIRVKLTEESGELRFTVSDHGSGFDPESVERGAGLVNMSDRIDSIGGELEIAAAEGGGSTISATIPILVGVERT